MRQKSYIWFYLEMGFNFYARLAAHSGLTGAIHKLAWRPRNEQAQIVVRKVKVAAGSERL